MCGSKCLRRCSGAQEPSAVLQRYREQSSTSQSCSTSDKLPRMDIQKKTSINWWQQCCGDIPTQLIPLSVPWCIRRGESRKLDASGILVCPHWYLSHFQSFVIMCCVTPNRYHLESQEITSGKMKNVDISMEAGQSPFSEISCTFHCNDT